MNVMDSVPQVDGRAAGLKGPGILGGAIWWNAVIRLGCHVLTLLAGLYTVSFVIGSVGVEAFGIIGVVNAFLAYLSVGTISLTSTVGRNVTFALEEGDSDRAARELSTAVFGVVAVFSVLLPACALFVRVEYLIVMPAGEEAGAHLLLLLAVASLVFGTLSGPLGAAMFVRNRLDLLGGVFLARSLLFLLCVAILLGLGVPGLPAYGLASLVASVVVFLLDVGIHRALLKGIEISPRLFDWAVLRGTFSLGGWMVVGQIGGLFVLQADVVVANRVLGAAAAGQFAALAIVSLQLRSLVSLVSGLFAPSQTVLAARGEDGEFSRHLFRSIRVVTLLVALLVGVFCGLAREVLTLWLGERFAPLTPLAIVLTAPLVPILGVMPAWNAVLALGKVKIPALATLVMGIGSVFLSVFLAGSAGWGLVGIAAAGGITLSVKNAVFAPWYLWRLTGLPPWGFLRETAWGIGSALAIFLLTTGIRSWLGASSLLSLSAAVSLSLLLGAVLVAPLLLAEVGDHRTVSSSPRPGVLRG